MNSATFKFSRNPILFWFVSLPLFLWMVTIGECKRMYHIFSIPELLRTLFAPWKKDDVSTQNLSLGDKFHVWAGNLAGRFIAFNIRTVTILIGLCGMILLFILGFLTITLVVCFPIIIILSFIWGLNGLQG